MGEYETCFWLIEGDTIQGFALQYYCEWDQWESWDLCIVDRTGNYQRALDLQFHVNETNCRFVNFELELPKDFFRLELVQWDKRSS
jgi:hypothetical protein